MPKRLADGCIASGHDADKVNKCAEIGKMPEQDAETIVLQESNGEK
jgi:hypothetical protein